MRMKGRKQAAWVEARALIQSPRGEYIIIRPHADADDAWHFPGGRVGPRESAEAGLRRTCRELLGVELTLHVGQPGFAWNFGTHSITYRYYVAGVARGRPEARACAELRWVLAGQLRDYVFDPPTQQVVDWLLE
jgi:ADP-ribose pyrophosphatase YjhB (NUDIX family)